ncbi:MAG: cytidylate kinase family protein [Patescibacteria group bacterium]
MIITISGTPGSGKSTQAKLLAKKLGWKLFDVGHLRREIARRHNMTIEELNKLGEKENWTDKEVDGYIKKLSKKFNNIIFDGRIAFYIIPSSLKLFITVNPKIGAARVFSQLQKDKEGRNEGRHLTTVKKVEQSHKNRTKSDNKRYKKYYGINFLNKSQYDFILDTTKLTIQQGFNKLYSFIKKKIKS